jgi:hypothetical protein
MERFISLRSEQVKELAAKMDMTIAMVHRCLSYSNERAVAFKVRREALAMGGVPMLTAPECETIHDADGFMRQYFNNGAQIIVDKRVGRVTLINPDGDLEITVNSGCSIHELMNIQLEAEKMKRRDDA